METDEERKELHAAVREAYDAGLCVVPPREDGSKAPEGYWGEFIQERASIEILRDAYRNGRHGMGIVCGRVSNNLECCEFETEVAYRSFKVAAALAGLDELVERIEEGYLEQAPRGGFHWLWYSELPGTGRKLAMVATGDPAAPYQTMIETRFEGQFIITAPSHGPVHPSGRPYIRVKGGFGSIVKISDEDRQALFRVAETLDQCPKSDDGFAMFRPDTDHEGEGDRPGDDFIRRGNWHDDVLLPAGWKLVGQGTDREGQPQEFWRRPGKDQGNSATLHPFSGPGGHGLFVPYSTSTPFPVAQRGYNKFRTLAFLLHEGDFRTTGRALAAAGYGKKKEPEPSTAIPREESAERLTLSAPEILAFEIPEVATLPMLGRDGLIMAGGTNLIYAYPKVGKTELLTAIVGSWAEDGMRIFYLTEEPFGNWKIRLGIHGCSSPALRMHYAWGYSVAQAVEVMATEVFDVLVVDTLRYTVGYQEGEGDKDVSRILIPLFRAAEGKTVLCSYHARKMPGEGGRDISGHHSLYGAFDRALQLTPVDGHDDHRRVIVSGRCMYEGDFTLTYKQEAPGIFLPLDAGSVLDQAARVPKTFRVKCAADGCPNWFEAQRKTARFCSERCKKRERRATDREHHGDNVVPLCLPTPRDEELAGHDSSENPDGA